MTFIDNFKDKTDENSAPIIPYLVLSYLVLIILIIILTFVNSILLIMSCDDKEYEKINIKSNTNPHIRNTAIFTLILSLIVSFLFIYIIINIVFKKKLIGKGFALSLFVFFYVLFSIFSIASSSMYIANYSSPRQQYFNLGLNIFILFFYGLHFPFPLLSWFLGFTINFMYQNMQ